jgi:hypothetical protein
MVDLPPVGILTDVPIRAAFPREATHFSPWLATDEALTYLARRLDLGELTLSGTEVPIPGGRALDILALDADGRRIAIENQFGQADHDHLTRGLAYAVGLNARALIIVAEGHRDEFIAVADYLNSVAEQAEDGGIAVFLVRARVVRIHNEQAVDFDVVAGPNRWKAAVAQSAPPPVDADLPVFWDRLEEAAQGQFPVLDRIGPLARMGNFNGFRSNEVRAIRFDMSVAKKHCYAYVALDAGSAEATNGLFDQLHTHQSEIEQQVGSPLEWDRRDEKTTARITARRHPFGYSTAYDDSQLRELIRDLQLLSDSVLATLNPPPS